MEYSVMLKKLDEDSIKNEEIYNCLISKNFNIVGQAIYKIIDRRYCDEYIIMALTKIALMLNNHKVVGPYQIGHLAISALFLVEDRSALGYFTKIYNDLNNNDKFLVDNFIKGMRERRDERMNGDKN